MCLVLKIPAEIPEPSAEATPNPEESTKLQMMEKLFSENTPMQVIILILASGGKQQMFDNSSQPAQVQKALGPFNVYTATDGRRMIGLGYGAGMGFLPKYGLKEMALALGHTVPIEGSKGMGAKSLVQVSYPRFRNGELTGDSRVLIFSEEQVKQLRELVDKNKE